MRRKIQIIIALFESTYYGEPVSFYQKTFWITIDECFIVKKIKKGIFFYDRI
jgi:hypothetical protein